MCKEASNEKVNENENNCKVRNHAITQENIERLRIVTVIFR